MYTTHTSKKQYRNFAHGTPRSRTQARVYAFRTSEKCCYTVLCRDFANCTASHIAPDSMLPWDLFPTYL